MTTGGVQLNEYVLYNCLENEANVYSQSVVDWVCPVCGEGGPDASVLSRAAHLIKCARNQARRRTFEFGANYLPNHFLITAHGSLDSKSDVPLDFLS